MRRLAVGFLVLAGAVYGGSRLYGPVSHTAALHSGRSTPGRERPSTVLTTSLWSVALHRRVQVVVYLPPGYHTGGVQYPVFYLLHGVPGSAPSMFTALDLKSTMDRLIQARTVPPMIVVAPSDGPRPATDTEWADSPLVKSKWGSLVADDLVSWVQGRFPVCERSSGRAIGGLSMGAFGAMNLALHHLGEFGSVTLWSGYFLGNTPSIEGPSGSTGWEDDSPLEYLPSMAAALDKTPLRISFYSSPTDRFYPQNVALARLLRSMQIPYRFNSYPGGHSFTLWRHELAFEMTWLGRGFGC